jgi:glycosyltransferase involved in cell wall biosynthesis
MRLLILTEVSESSRVWESAVPRLLDRGVEVTLAAVRGPGPLHEKARAMGARTLALGCTTGRDYLPAAVKLSGQIRHGSYDVIHACEAIPAAVGGLAGLLARREARIYHWQHSHSEGRQRVLSRAGGRFARLVVACSHAAAEYAGGDESVPADRIRVVYNGVVEPRRVNRAELEEIRGRLGIEREAQVVSMITRLRAEKGVMTLLDAFPLILRSASRPIHCVIAGEGPQRAQLAARAREVDGGRIHLVGHQQDIAPWLELADVMAMPSHREAFGLAAAEALAKGRPLVASSVGGLKEIVEDGVSGRLVQPREPAELAQAVVQVLETPDFAKRLGAAGYSRYRKLFTMDAMVEGLLRSYRELT